MCWPSQGGTRGHWTAGQQAVPEDFQSEASVKLPEFSLGAALAKDEGEPAILSLPLRKQLYDHYMTEARRWVERLRTETAAEQSTLGGELEELQFFSLPAGHRGPGGAVD